MTPQGHTETLLQPLQHVCPSLTWTNGHEFQVQILSGPGLWFPQIVCRHLQQVQTKGSGESNGCVLLMTNTQRKAKELWTAMILTLLLPYLPREPLRRHPKVTTSCTCYSNKSELAEKNSTTAKSWGHTWNLVTQMSSQRCLLCSDWPLAPLEGTLTSWTMKLALLCCWQWWRDKCCYPRTFSLAPNALHKVQFSKCKGIYD